MFTLTFRGAIVLCLLITTAPVNSSGSDSDDSLVATVRQILKTTPLIDGHNDAPWTIRDKFKSNVEKVDFRSDTSRLEPPMHTDINRLRKGGVGAQFWSVYVPVEIEGADAVHAVLEQIDIVHRIVRRYPDVFEIALTAADIERIHRAGKIGSLIGIEGGHCINNSLGVLRALYAAGARYMTLTHWKNTGWADAATAKPEHDGLSEFGEQVVREMNWMGMLVDLSHVSEETMKDVLNITKSPVIFSHSSARAISQHKRNVPDNILRALRKTDGVVMINFAPAFITEQARQWGALKDAEEARLKALFPEDPDRVKGDLEQWEKRNPSPGASLQQVADHIDHIRKIAGVKHIGLGSDYDGISSTPVGLEDVSRFPALLAELMKRGYTKEDIASIAGLNLLRVMKRVEIISAALQKERSPSSALFEPK